MAGFAERFVSARAVRMSPSGLRCAGNCTNRPTPKWGVHARRDPRQGRWRRISLGFEWADDALHEAVVVGVASARD